MASSLEQFVVTVTSLSSQGNFTSLYEFLNSNIDVLAKNSTHLDDVLQTLDLQLQPAAILYILYVKFSQPQIPEFEGLFAQVQELITMCAADLVRFCSDKFSQLCHLLTQALIERKQPMRGIYLLCAAIPKIQSFPSQMTPVHADLCQLCLLSKCLKPVLPFLNEDITEINNKGGQFDVKDFLLYYYYGGMIYVALKEFDRAIYFFEVAITAPSHAVSHIVLEAYKKYLLVSLIQYGKLKTLPKYTSHVNQRFIKPLSQMYYDLATAYSSNDLEGVNKVINKDSEVFIRDKNMGLVKQCLSSIHKKNIQRLTKTFLTLSLTDMANRVHLSGPKEAEKYVLHMIEDGEIFATINQKDGMVVFHDNPEKYNDCDMTQQIDEEMKKCMSLEEKLIKMDQAISVNPQYVQKIANDINSSAPRNII
ncbi:COP9 signalosome complex subunit 3 [Nymphon striatum]|nr:COP9 signalosome complex subunit 3 [Nymphon striatum]KAG1682966.1 COP9 signalosome complex subunit 3 [Nymphon striatum]